MALSLGGSLWLGGNQKKVGENRNKWGVFSQK